MDDLQKQLIQLREELYQLKYDGERHKQIKELQDKIAYLEYILKQVNLFNSKVNQAYVNNEVTNINLNQRIDDLKTNTIDIQESIKALKNDNQQLDTSISADVSELEKKFNELANDQNLIFQALLNMQQTFDVFNTMLMKERIMNTSIITVVTVELLSTGILNGNNYINNLRNIIMQIVNAYKAAGCEIDFSQELEALNNKDAAGAIAIQIPQVVHVPKTKDSIQKDPIQNNPLQDESFQDKLNEKETNNIINFNDILNKKSKKKVTITAEEKSKLYTTFQDKLNEVLDNKIKRKRTRKTKKNNDTNIENNTDKK